MPWGRLDDSLYDHPKLDRLPVDRRLEAIGLWARSISWCNRFLTDGHVPRSRIPKLDATTELADILVAAGMFEESPSGYIVHDFLEFNDSREQVEARRKRDADRKAKWRANRDESASERSHSGTSRSARGVVPGGVTPSVRAESQVESHDSRARSARESRPDPTRPVPSENLSGENPRGRRRDERADMAALRARGWKRVSAAQRTVLDEIAARHDETGHAFAAEAIMAAPDGADPLAAAMEADRLWQASRRRQAEAAEGEAERARAAEASAPAPDWLRPLADAVGRR